MTSSNYAIKLADVKKSFDIPSEKKNTLVEYLSKPFRKVEGNRLDVLKDIDLEIKKG